MNGLYFRPVKTSLDLLQGNIPGGNHNQIWCGNIGGYLLSGSIARSDYDAPPS